VVVNDKTSKFILESLGKNFVIVYDEALWDFDSPEFKEAGC
jgi:hypothetical protein